MEALNLHINYACPLSCKYCVQRGTKDILGEYLTADEMIEKVQTFLNYINKPYCRINISGGEPLLKFNDIKKLIETFPKNTYEISTSGYLLTEEKVKFFSLYNVMYILSIDGGEKVTKYLRPTVNGQLNYFSELKKNLPHLLYYAPYTRAKLIVSKNLISEIFNSYLELERLGFQEIFITPNVYENEVDNNNPELSTGNWDEEDWINFHLQLKKIINEIKLGIMLNKKRCIITNIESIIFKTLVPPDEKELNENYMICDVLQYRTGMGPNKGQYKIQMSPISYCMRHIDDNVTTQEELVNKANLDFQNLGNTCIHDPECPYFQTCKYSTCICENIKAKFTNMWYASPFQCKTQKIYHNLANDLLFFLEEHKEKEVINKHYFRRIIEKKKGVE